MRNPASPDESFLFSSLPFSLAPCSGCQPLRGAPLRCAPTGDDALRVVQVCGYRDGEHRAALRADVRSGLRPESNREHDFGLCKKPGSRRASFLGAEGEGAKRPEPLPRGERGGQSIKGGEAGKRSNPEPRTAHRASMARIARTHPLRRRRGWNPKILT